MSIPTRLKLDIRDQWTKEDCELQLAFKEITKVVGYRISCSPDWHLLWTELKTLFPDPGTFIPNVRGIVVLWSRTLIDLLQDEQNEEWTEQVLEELSKTQFVKIHLEVGSGELPGTRWTDDSAAFMITLPKSGPKIPSDIVNSIGPALLDCFKTTNTDNLPAERLFPDDSWSDIGVDSTSGHISTRVEQMRLPATTSMAHSAVTILPDINTMERPEYLMLKPPYHLTISGNSSHGMIVIQCSHPPTLKVIEAYLKKWTKREFNNVHQPPAALLSLKESHLGLGAIYNTLQIKLQERSSYVLTPTFLVSFVQSILGYGMTYEESSYWSFRKDTAFDMR
ncbi:uncharacterized protein BDR25DRAFT_266421 [Lindgomyces ingoldianus]|uniref:Uncharacterized protein n=1 Tax=Lindgomyces ingoldianus TaxID=673940 RepID=A0ACB6QN48_9PLEO|nr:uncharacterized protein BDR25DRAFT_266421 [Lindgomyces ingoldianus]KAF2467950.1 hypothetical protein BDR25DRAFT_266421 [Lindgomyces ingoldianus]